MMACAQSTEGRLYEVIEARDITSMNCMHPGSLVLEHTVVLSCLRLAVLQKRLVT